MLIYNGLQCSVWYIFLLSLKFSIYDQSHMLNNYLWPYSVNKMQQCHFTASVRCLASEKVQLHAIDSDSKCLALGMLIFKRLTQPMI